MTIAQLSAALTILGILACKRPGAGQEAQGPLRVGFFPNLTHAQALVGAGEGTFAKDLQGRFSSRQFNAGPAAMEALMAGDVDVSYVGPGPATIAYLRSGHSLRVIAGAVSGGAELIARTARKPQDLKGKRVRESAAREHAGHRPAHVAPRPGVAHGRRSGRCARDAARQS